MNRTERLYRIHNLLKGSRPVSMQRLMEELEASRATIVRDLEYLRLFMEAPVEYDRARNGYLYRDAEDTFELPGLWFNASELYALMAVEQLLESVQPGLLGPYLGPLKRRVRRLLKEAGPDADQVGERVRIQPVAYRTPEPDSFRRVAEATLGGRRLAMTYHSRGRNEVAQRRVHPQRLIHYRHNWYLAAWCERAGDLRLFALDRIEAPHPDETPADPMAEADLDRALQGAFGIFTGTARAWAVIRFSPEAARWVAEETWHPDQIGQWRDDGYELQVPYSDPTELVMEILRHGPDAEILAPAELREHIAGRLAAARTHYE